jgi:hypothetical protein
VVLSFVNARIFAARAAVRSRELYSIRRRQIVVVRRC